MQTAGKFCPPLLPQTKDLGFWRPELTDLPQECATDGWLAFASFHIVERFVDPEGVKCVGLASSCSDRVIFAALSTPRR